MKTLHCALYLTLPFLCLCLHAGCGNPSPSKAGDGQPDGGGAGPMEPAADVPDSAASAVDCADAADCSNSKVCHPFLRTCVSPGATCDAQTACPEASYCESQLGVCLQAATGTPCATDANCAGSCAGGVCGCDGLVYEQPLKGALDVYLVLDRSGSMGADCDYQPGAVPPEASKACFATYALSDYMTELPVEVDTRLAFQFFSLDDSCDPVPYATPLVDLTQLPVQANDPLISEISDETFDGFGLKTRVEPALRGIAAYTAANQTPGREMIGVLMTDGDANACEADIGALSKIIADHRAATGLRTYVIGMDGASETNLEELAVAGGADAHDDFCGSLTPPCHYWNVGQGSGDVVASALRAITEMATPLPCTFPVTELTPPPGEALDYNRINVTLQKEGSSTTIGQVPSAGACEGAGVAWHYDQPSAPTEIRLCPSTCSLVRAAGAGARVNVVVGCQDTIPAVI